MMHIIRQDAIRILTQAHDLLSCPAICALPFEQYIGPHMRHIIEHFESLLNASTRVDYDARARDLSLQTNRAIALSRLSALQNQLLEPNNSVLTQTIDVCLRCGANGEFESISRSSMGRELMFVSSHATHHYALIKLHCMSMGINIDSSFGKAPATLAFELSTQRSAS